MNNVGTLLSFGSGTNSKEMDGKKKMNNNYKELWYTLKSDMENAVSEGYQQAFDKGDTANSGAFKAYKYILDIMNKMDGESNENE